MSSTVSLTESLRLFSVSRSAESTLSEKTKWFFHRAWQVFLRALTPKSDFAKVASHKGQMASFPPSLLNLTPTRDFAEVASHKNAEQRTFPFVETSGTTHHVPTRIVMDDHGLWCEASCAEVGHEILEVVTLNAARKADNVGPQ